MKDLSLILLPLILGFIMFSLGLELRVKDFTNITKYPKAFLLGLTNQMLLVPLVAFGLVLLWQPAPEFAFGIMLLSFCPGGVSSNLLAKFAKGNVALSISLTAVVSLLSVITLPLLIGWAYSYFINDQVNDINVLRIGVSMFLITALPVLLGLFIHERFTSTAQKIQKGVSALASVLFLLIMVAAIASNWAVLQEQFPNLGGLVISLLVVLFVLGSLTTRMVGLSWFDAKTIAIESGIQNGSLAITVAGLIVAGSSMLPVYALPAAVYGVLMYAVAAPYIVFARKR